MVSKEHQLLAQYIKDVHAELRKSSSNSGALAAWNQHCENKDVLKKYAKYMEKLATTHWEKNYSNESSNATSRIEWAVNFIRDYFINSQWGLCMTKELEIATKLNLKCDKEDFSNPIKLLDVGSCYNPFKKYKWLDVIALDLCPANNYVYECDFLTVSVGTETILNDDKVTQLQQQSFDVVTFCFLLEYIPSSDLRMNACQKAYSLLKPGGLLIINTPDSKHVGANSRLMKCWRYTLALIGFNRIKYQKFKHMHCMAFRRSLHKEIARRWAHLHKEPFMEMAINIPQDFHKYVNKDEDQKGILEGQHCESYDFRELPYYGDSDL